MTVPDTEYTKAEVSKRKASFADYLKQSAFAVTWEAIPSESIGAEINNASVEVKRDFTQKALSLLLDKDGNDILAKSSASRLVSIISVPGLMLAGLTQMLLLRPC